MKTTVICIKSSNPSVFVVGKEYRLETVYGDQYVNSLRVGPFAVSSTLQHESEDGVFSFYGNTYLKQEVKEELPAFIRDEKQLRNVIDFIKDHI